MIISTLDAPQQASRKGIDGAAEFDGELQQLREMLRRSVLFDLQLIRLLRRCELLDSACVLVGEDQQVLPLVDGECEQLLGGRDQVHGLEGSRGLGRI
jgi:hypothetical protein